MGFRRRGLAALLVGSLAPDCQAGKQDRGVAIEVHVAVVIARFVHLDEAVRENSLRRCCLLEETICVWVVGGVLQSFAELVPDRPATRCLRA